MKIKEKPKTTSPWWAKTYRAAESSGLKIKSFDLKRAAHIEGKFLTTPLEVAKKILRTHVTISQTYKTAAKFLLEWDKLSEGDDYSGINDHFLYHLCEDYSKILLKEHNKV